MRKLMIFLILFFWHTLIGILGTLVDTDQALISISTIINFSQLWTINDLGRRSLIYLI